MAKKEKSETTAVIDIGSNELRLAIAEDRQGRMKLLEHISYPLSLGRETFSNEKISFEYVEITCASIKNFLDVMKEYDAARYRAVATTAIRESKNRDYILDQIKIKTGVTLDVLDDAEEKLYIYKLMASLVGPEYLNSALMVYSGSGNTGVSVWEGGVIPYMQNVRMGSLRLSELFVDIQDYTGQFHTVVMEYIKSLTDFLDFPEKIQYLIASGQEAQVIASLTGAKRDKLFSTIDAGKLDNLFEDIKNKTEERIAEDYSLPREKAEVLLPAVLTYMDLLSRTEAAEIITPPVLLSDALMYEMLYPQRFAEINREFDKSTLISAEAIAAKFMMHAEHYKAVERQAVQIFDRLKKIHGMGKREKLLLQTAAILHDTGKVININSHYRHSYDIVKGSSVIGLNSAETEIVALLCLYHSRPTPETEPEQYMKIGISDRVLVSKLTAILRLAEALDSSHRQKIGEAEPVVNEKEFVLIITTNENIDLEIWSFEEKAAMFQDVFGLKASIRQRRMV